MNGHETLVRWGRAVQPAVRESCEQQEALIVVEAALGDPRLAGARVFVPRSQWLFFGHELTEAAPKDHAWQSLAQVDRVLADLAQRFGAQRACQEAEAGFTVDLDVLRCGSQETRARLRAAVRSARGRTAPLALALVLEYGGPELARRSRQWALLTV